MTESSSIKKLWAQPPASFCVALVMLVAIAVYINTLWNGFAYDDDWIIVRNDRVHQLKDLGQIWGTPYWPTFGQVLGLYRPLAIFAYAIEWAVADGKPWLFHAVNIVLHAAASGLVFLLLLKLATARGALVGALVFAVHPVHTESVANSVGQAELLSAIFTIAACLLYASRDESTPAVPLWQLLALPICYLGGLLTKEAAITLPGLLVLMDVAQQRLKLAGPTRTGPLGHELNRYLRGVWLLYFVLIATAVVYLALRVDVLGSISGSDAGPSLPFLREGRRILTAFRAWPEYVRLLVFPVDLSADYSPAVILPVESLTPMATLGAAIFLLTIALALATPWHTHAGFPAAWFLITIFTVSNLVFPIGVVVAERTLYLPSVAIAAVAGFAWQALDARATAVQLRLSPALLLLVLGLLGYRTMQRNPDWKSTPTILLALVRDHPESYRVAWILADQYWRRGNLAESAKYWEAALLLWPRDSQLLTEYANFNIGNHNWKRAIELLERSRALHPWVPYTSELLAYSYVHSGRNEEAIEVANRGIGLEGRRSLLLAIKARAYEQQGRLAEAVAAWRVATGHQAGKLWLYHAMMARALARYGDTNGASQAAALAMAGAALDSTVVNTLGALQAAIVSGCYRQNPPPSCADPLADWTLSPERWRTTTGPSQNASKTTS
jgi:protein O-mannosyl-transferase